MDNSEKISILDLFILLLERKKMYIVIVLLFCIAGVTFSMIIPKFYASSSVILAPKDKMPAGLSSLMSDLPVGGMMKSLNFGGGSDADEFISILRSRRIADKAIKEFRLLEHFKMEKRKKYFYEDVLKNYYKMVGIDQDDYDNIVVTVVDSNPALCANMANYIVAQLDTITYQIEKESAKNSRLFFAERLKVIKSDLDQAHQKFTEFQITNRYLDLGEQLKASIGALSELESQRMGIDMQLAQIRAQFGENSQRVSELKKNRDVLNREIERYMNEGSGELILALKKAPALSVQYAYLLRDVKVQETLYSFVLQMFEQAKLTEANNTPAVKVLEYASVPQKKIRPKRSIICILFFFVGNVAAAITILLLKWYRVQKDLKTPLYGKMQRVVELTVPGKK